MLTLPRAAKLLRLLLLGTVAVPLLAETQFAVNVGWLPVTEQDRTSTIPVVEKDAGVEALFWNVYVADEFKGQDWERRLYHYVRLKVFNEKGKEIASTLEIPFSEKTGITYISGRTIKPDGTILELKKDSIFERDSLRAGRLRRKVKSLAMPGVEPGAIVEYRWQEIRFNQPLMYIRLHMQREYPVRKVTYYIKPLPRDMTGAYGMSLWPFNCEPTKMHLEPNGFTSTSLSNVPAYRDEPMMPGEGSVRPWVLAYYHADNKRDPEKYWADVGKKAYSALKAALKVNNELKAAAESAVKPDADEQEKALGLIRYIRKNMRSFYDRRVTDAERAAIIKATPKDRVRTSAEVFKSGIGSPDELNTLLAAMASYVGLDARPVMVANRDDIAFDPSLADQYFLPNLDMAIKVGNDWRLFDVSARRLPPHMVGWREEAARVLVSDPKKPFFIVSPVAPPDASQTRRTAQLTLSADGVLEGVVEEVMTGHVAEQRRVELDDQEPAKQQEDIKQKLTALFPQAEVGDVQVSGVDDAEKPLVVRFHIRIPDYAQRTAKRMLFQPLPFLRSVAPLFDAADRKYDIFMPHAWLESDTMELTLPAGMALDNAENPGGLTFGEPGAYTLEMGINKAGHLMVMRSLTFGQKGLIFFPQKAYPQLKRIFDEIHTRDGVTLSLKQAPPKASGE